MKKIPFFRFNWKSLIVLFVVLTALASSSHIFSTIVKSRDIPFPWDSAAHACEGLKIARDLRSGDVISFIGDTYRQGWWPFFHSWLLAPGFILFGYSYMVARSVSLFCFVLFIPVIFLLGLQMSEDRGRWVGFLAVFLVLTSQPFLVLSSMCMSEIPGLFMTFLTFLIYLYAEKSRSKKYYIMVGILMALTLFTKWHHGLFVLLAIALSQLTLKKKILSRDNLSLFLPFAAIMLGWFAYPRHITSFFEHATFQPQFYTLLSFDNLFFYVKSFFQNYHSSLAIACITALGFIFSLKKINNLKVRPFALFVVIGFVLMTIKLDNRSRYVVTLLPAVWLLASMQIVDFFFYLKNHLPSKKIKVIFASILAIGIIGFSIPTIPRLYKRYPDSLVKYNFWADEKSVNAYEYIAENVDDHDRITLFSSFDYFNSLKSPTIRWYIEVRRSKDKESTAAKKRQAGYYLSQLLKNRDRTSYQGFIEFLETKDVEVLEYHLVSFLKIQNPEAYQKLREQIKLNPFSDKIAELDSLDEKKSCLITILRDEEQEFEVHSKQFFSRQKTWEKYSEQKFEELDITITIYERVGARNS